MAKEKDTQTQADKTPEQRQETQLASPVVETTKVETVAVTTAAPVDPTSDGPGRYRVTLSTGEDAKVAELDAESRNHAWAMFCDGLKSWPSPKRVDRKIERIA